MRAIAYATAWTAAIGGLVTATDALAQPALDRVLTEAHVTEGQQCSVVRIDFNSPVRYISHFPTNRGADLHIKVRPIEHALDDEFALHREALRVSGTPLTPVQAIDFEGNQAEGPTVHFVLSRSMFFRVGQGADFRSLVIVLADKAERLDCAPTERPATTPPGTTPSGATPSGATPAGRATAERAPGPATTAAGASQTDQLALPPSKTPQASNANGFESLVLLHDARTAMLERDYPKSIALLTKLLQDPSGPTGPEAQELLGLARERNGQLAQATGEYQEYLRRYPTGDGADRVRQRLAGILGSATPHAQLRRAERAPETGKVEWAFDASLSQYYLRDETFRSTDIPVLGTVTTNDLNQNEILTALDATASARSNAFQAKLRVATTYTNDFRASGSDQGSVSALYLELSDAQQRVLGRIGRQTRSSDGILGRFDGALVTVRAGSKLKFNVAAGFPVQSSHDLTIGKDPHFYAASIGFGRFGGFDGDVYALRQESGSFIDRESTGLELRYLGSNASAFSLLDYDVHFNQVNIALFNTSVTFKDQSVISLSADYRRAPLLTTTNALIGQTAGSLDELKSTYTPAQIQQLAEDRTAYSRTGTITASHPLSERFSVDLDATVANVSDTKDSGGVPATPKTGDEYYYSAQVVGTSMFKDGDVSVVGFRYADLQTSNRYVLDLNTRYPVSRTFYVNPRVRVSYRENKNNPDTQVAARPSLKLNYKINKKVQLEFEGGAEWQHDDMVASTQDSIGYFANLGYRWDF